MTGGAAPSSFRSEMEGTKGVFFYSILFPVLTVINHKLLRKIIIDDDEQNMVNISDDFISIIL